MELHTNEKAQKTTTIHTRIFKGYSQRVQKNKKKKKCQVLTKHHEKQQMNEKKNSVVMFEFK